MAISSVVATEHVHFIDQRPHGGVFELRHHCARHIASVGFREGEPVVAVIYAQFGTQPMALAGGAII